MIEVVRQLCNKRMEARNTLRNWLVVGLTAVLTYLSVLLFHIVTIKCTMVRLNVLCFLKRRTLTFESKIFYFYDSN